MKLRERKKKEDSIDSHACCHRNGTPAHQLHPQKATVINRDAKLETRDNKWTWKPSPFTLFSSVSPYAFS